MCNLILIRLRRGLMLICLVALGSLTMPVAHAETLLDFNPTQREQYQTLLNELRCMKCPNTNLAGSDIDLAKDMKALIYQRLRAGEAPEEIKAWLVARYGEFILYQPRWSWRNALLWLLPTLFALFGFLCLRRLFSGA